MGLEQWGASEQYYKIASVHPEYELGRVISQEKDLFNEEMYLLCQKYHMSGCIQYEKNNEMIVELYRKERNFEPQYIVAFLKSIKLTYFS